MGPPRSPEGEYEVSQPNSVISVPRPGRDPIQIGNDKKLTLIAGPCQLESREHGLEVSGRLKEIADRLDIGLIYKTSYDKANRTSISSARGMGLEASLPVFNEIRETTGLPVLTDVHTAEQATIAAQAVDVIQIPAFLCRQTDLLIAAAETGKPVNVKKGQFLAPWDMAAVVERVLDRFDAQSGLIDAPMTLDNVLQTDHLARAWADEAMKEQAG